MTVVVLRVRDPALFGPPQHGEDMAVGTVRAELAELVERACASSAQFPDGQEALGWLAEHAGKDSVACFVARDRRDWVGWALVVDWTDAFARLPFCGMFYVPNNREARIALGKAMAAWVRERGWTHFAAINQSDRDDARWLACAKQFAAGTIRGSYAEFEVGEADG